MKLFRIILLSLFTLAFFGCEKPVDAEKATVMYWGPAQSDGCGYMIELSDGSVVHPVNLPIRFQRDELEIAIEYTVEEAVYSCGWLTVMYDAITLESIQKW